MHGNGASVRDDVVARRVFGPNGSNGGKTTALQRTGDVRERAILDEGNCLDPWHERGGGEHAPADLRIVSAVVRRTLGSAGCVRGAEVRAARASQIDLGLAFGTKPLTHGIPVRRASRECCRGHVALGRAAAPASDSPTRAQRARSPRDALSTRSACERALLRRHSPRALSRGKKRGPAYDAGPRPQDGPNQSNVTPASRRDVSQHPARD